MDLQSFNGKILLEERGNQFIWHSINKGPINAWTPRKESYCDSSSCFPLLSIRTPFSGVRLCWSIIFKITSKTSKVPRGSLETCHDPSTAKGHGDNCKWSWNTWWPWDSHLFLGAILPLVPTDVLTVFSQSGWSWGAYFLGGNPSHLLIPYVLLQWIHSSVKRLFSISRSMSALLPVSRPFASILLPAHRSRCESFAEA